MQIDSRDEMEAVQQNGLVKGHAYGVTNLKTILNNEVPGLLSFLGAGNRSAVRLIRLRNPWGRKEWNGRFSDGSPEWNQISQQKRKELGLIFEDDGEFWMAFDDFCKHFTSVSLCRIIYNSLIGSLLSGGAKNWSEGVFKGEWKQADKCGGCINNLGTFFNNPQYRFDVANDDEPVMISLSQPDNRHMRSSGGGNYLTIGFYVMRIEINRKTRVRMLKAKAGCSAYGATRTRTLHMTLKPGRYCVIPTTFEPGQEGQFLLRVLTSYDCHPGTLEVDLPKQKLMGGLMSGGSIDAQYLMSVTVRQADGLPLSAKGSLPDPFVVLDCEGKTAKTPVVFNSTSPVFNETALFYRKTLAAPVNLQVLNRNLMKDTLIGQTSMSCNQVTNGRVRQFQCPLQGKDSAAAGVIVIDVAIYTDLAAV
ncbi:hypothetical protein RvY_15199-2 [Ramazzottius varieornatus]|uniref:Calpain catalytic domain-containing protein n=1 Tax=Ramazzottius varieornatus TaxID=947166 RepID=A0A1D1VYU7_RAMVA|nr:hypothetical protein RvY_15199-2 [Ramazzottius varieornatus]